MCDFCKNFDFSSASWEVTKYGSHIKMAGGSYRYPINEQFNYCPICGSKIENKEDRDI